MTANAIRRPAALVKQLEKARAKPVILPKDVLDVKSTVRRESLGDMPIGELLALTGYSRAKEHSPHRLQRDTQARLLATRRSSHLRCFNAVPTPQHHISLVWFKNEVEVVDGNTRLTLWSGQTNEEVMVPAKVLVTMFYPADEAEYDELYRCFDSNESRKTNQDNLFGMMRAIGLKPTSDLLRKNKVVSAICSVAGVRHSPEQLFEGVRALAKPLEYLDSYGFSAAPRVSYGAGVYAGLLSVLQGGYNFPAIAAFALELKNCREKAGYQSKSEVIQQFMADYPEAKSVSAGAAVKRVRELTERMFKKFETEYTKASPVKSKAKVVHARAKKVA